MRKYFQPFPINSMLSKYIKKIAVLGSVFVAGATVGTFTIAGAAISFPDVPNNSWFASAVSDMSTLGIIKGHDDGTFGAGDPVTREEVAVMLQRMWNKLADQGAVDPITSDSRSVSSRSRRSSSSSSTNSTSSTSSNNGAFRFTVDTFSISESSPTASVSIVRTGSKDGAVSVKYATKNGTATEGEDYTNTSGTLNFADGESTKNISVSIKNDDLAEDAETFMVELSDATGGATVIDPKTVTITINDNDSANSSSSSSATSGDAGRLSFSAEAYTIHENQGSVTINVKRTEGTKGEVSVKYSTSNGSAESSNYDSVNGTLTFPDGDTEESFVVVINDNNDKKGNKTVNLTLSDPTGGVVLGNASVVLTIADDDIIANTNSGTILFEEDEYTFQESDGEVQIAVIRQTSFNDTVSVDYEDTVGTAKVPSDYQDFSGTLVFQKGESKKYITIKLVEDDNKEIAEKFSAVLKNPSGASLGIPSSTSITIDD